MIVRTTEEITGTDRQRDTENWTSKRIVLADDGVGFSFHETTIHPGTGSSPGTWCTTSSCDSSM
ncbi:ectoine synthase [Mycobacteroides abscessus]|uniref:ectoine synthase n=1 Tax=Mycobacteroides abscessus TaxID=36809 RepID=UPI000C25A28B|nr:ectoine synthase [Mycobacteroides abscessus]